MKQYINLDAVIDFDREIDEETFDTFLDAFVELVESSGAVAFVYADRRTEEELD